MNKKVYKVAVVGAGKRGKLHARLFNDRERFYLVGLCDMDVDRLNAASEECGNPSLYTDAEKMLTETKPDIFCFCTPPAIRVDLFKLGIKHNVKLIAYEKPMSTNFKVGTELIKLGRASGIKVVVSHQQKYGPHFKAVKDIIDSGKLGRIHTITANVWGWYLHMVTHVMEYVRLFNNNEDAEWVISCIDGREKLEDNHPSPEYVGGFIQFVNGVRGIIEIGAKSPDVPEVDYDWHKGRFCVQGTKGFAECMLGAGWRSVTEDGYQSGPGKFDYDHDQGKYIDDIALYLDGEKEHPCNHENAYKGFELAMAMLRSGAQRKMISIPLEQGEDEIEGIRRAIPE